MTTRPYAVLAREDFQHLIDSLSNEGYRVLGPTVQDNAIVYDDVKTEADFPIGQTDEQRGGTYRLTPRNDQALFGYVVGPQSWKPFLHPPTVRLWQAERVNGTFTITETEPDTPRMAFIGVRACELHAIAIQDKIFLEGEFVDPTYKARREGLFIVAVNCGEAHGTCFCDSMGTGPNVEGAFDLALTEILNDETHYFVVEVGSERGAALLETLPHRDATDEDLQAAEQVVNTARQQMGRTLNTDGLPELLGRNLEHPQWDRVAARCLTCGNCTMVCPTCFCNTVEDYTDLSGQQAERIRQWDSCFTMDFSYIHGGSVRYSSKSRYRQWMTHKLSTWVDQFGMFGCVGCGRCITWCPVGIDLTEEAAAIREHDGAKAVTGKATQDGR